MVYKTKRNYIQEVKKSLLAKMFIEQLCVELGFGKIQEISN